MIRLKMAKNVLNMVLWHPEMERERSKISYIHRGARGNIKTIKGSSIDRLEGGFLILKDETQIPFHRIIKIEYDHEILWIK
jgi:uncharacterized protein (UPF0248 family)